MLWLERNMMPCFYKKYFGFECPGCGMQRSIVALLKGDIYDSFLLYPPLFITIALFIFLGGHLIFNFKHGASILKWLFILNVIIIGINYLYKIMNTTTSCCPS